jgi:hypothetical protein
MNATRSFVSLSIIAIIGTLPALAFADQHKAKEKTKAEHAEISSKKAKRNADEYQEEAAKQRKNSQTRDVKAARTKSKAMRENGSEDYEKKYEKKNAETNKTAREMQARKDERQSIKEDYRANREPGQEGTKGEGKPAKKPWWQFWGSDAAVQD